MTVRRGFPSRSMGFAFGDDLPDVLRLSGNIFLPLSASTENRILVLSATGLRRRLRHHPCFWFPPRLARPTRRPPPETLTVTFVTTASVPLIRVFRPPSARKSGWLNQLWLMVVPSPEPPPAERNRLRPHKRLKAGGRGGGERMSDNLPAPAFPRRGASRRRGMLPKIPFAGCLSFRPCTRKVP